MMESPAQQSQFFYESGYLVVKDILNPVQPAELRSMVDGALGGIHANAQQNVVAEFGVVEMVASGG